MEKDNYLDKLSVYFEFSNLLLSYCLPFLMRLWYKISTKSKGNIIMRDADKWHLMFTYKIIYNENVKCMKIRMGECVKGRNKYNENYIQNTQ